MSHCNDADVVFEILKKEGIRESHHGRTTDPKIPGNIQKARESGGALLNLEKQIFELSDEIVT